MTSINIVCQVDGAEEFRINAPFINYNINDNEMFSYTFWNNQLKRLPTYFSNVGIDLLCLSLFVFGADRIVPRKDFEDCWTRNINMYIPVLELEIWEQNKELVQNMLNYLSGDKWNLTFRYRGFTKNELEWKNRINNSNETKVNANKVCMFSGGLDSFIGVIDLLEVCNEEIIFVSHYGGGKGVKEYQDGLKDKFINNYNVNENIFFSFYAAAMNGKEDTTRTRSLMFFSHAIAIATCMNTQVNLIIPENGLISLNIPLTNSRLGSSSTRTTHPYYMKMLQELLPKLGIDIRVINPYQFKTKGEMIQQCKNIGFLKNNIVNTMSCSHPDHGRMLGETESCHCGNCLPCVIRRAAIKKSGIEDITIYRDKKFDSGKTANMNLNSYLLGIGKYDEKNSFLIIQKSGPLTSDLEKYSALYKRGLQELMELLEECNE